MKSASRRVFYEGRVQGVGFRWTVRDLAKGFDVSGSVRNLLDGRVELCVLGEEEEVDEFLLAIRESPMAGHIATEFAESWTPSSGLKGFSILP